MKLRDDWLDQWLLIVQQSTRMVGSGWLEDKTDAICAGVPFNGLITDTRRLHWITLFVIISLHIYSPATTATTMEDLHVSTPLPLLFNLHLVIKSNLFLLWLLYLVIPRRRAVSCRFSNFLWDYKGSVARYTRFAWLYPAVEAQLLAMCMCVCVWEEQLENSNYLFQLCNRIEEGLRGSLILRKTL